MLFITLRGIGKTVFQEASSLKRERRLQGNCHRPDRSGRSERKNNDLKGSVRKSRQSNEHPAKRKERREKARGKKRSLAPESRKFGTSAQTI